MRAASMCFLRISTGLLLIIWGIVKIGAPDQAIRISEKYYGGIVSMEMLQMPWGMLQVLIGGLVVLGLFRRYVYPLHAATFIVGLLTIWRHILDPYGRYLHSEEAARILFFPSLTVAAATLVLIAFMDEDRWSLDARRATGESQAD